MPSDIEPDTDPLTPAGLDPAASPDPPAKPPGPDSVEAVSNALVEFLDRMFITCRTDALDSLASTELSFSQIRVLFTLGFHNIPLPVNEIAEHVNLSVAAAGRTIDKLVTAGLVDRREDTTDRRIKRISLSADGRHFVDSHSAFRHDAIRNFVTALPTGDRLRLGAAITPILVDDCFPRPQQVTQHTPQENQ